MTTLPPALLVEALQQFNARTSPRPGNQGPRGQGLGGQGPGATVGKRSGEEVGPEGATRCDVDSLGHQRSISHQRSLGHTHGAGHWPPRVSRAYAVAYMRKLLGQSVNQLASAQSQAEGEGAREGGQLMEGGGTLRPMPTGEREEIDALRHVASLMKQLRLFDAVDAEALIRRPVLGLAFG